MDTINELKTDNSKIKKTIETISNDRKIKKTIETISNDRCRNTPSSYSRQTVTQTYIT